MHIVNDAGETIATVGSDAEAVRWWMDQGRKGDRLADTGELLSQVATTLWPTMDVAFDGLGQVVVRDPGEADD